MSERVTRRAAEWRVCVSARSPLALLSRLSRRRSSFLVLQGCRCLTYRHGEGEEDLALAHLRAHRLRVSSPFASPAVLCEQGLSRTVVSRSRPLERESERASGRPYTSCSGLVSCVQATGLMLVRLTKHAAVMQGACGDAPTKKADSRSRSEPRGRHTRQLSA